MNQSTTTTPAPDTGTPDTGTPDTGTPDTGTLLMPADFRPDDLPKLLGIVKRFVAVCDNGDLLPLSTEQFRDNWLKRGPKLGEQFARDDIAFLCTEEHAQQWPTRESIVEHVARQRAELEEAAKTEAPSWTLLPYGSLPNETRPALYIVPDVATLYTERLPATHDPVALTWEFPSEADNSERRPFTPEEALYFVALEAAQQHAEAQGTVNRCAHYLKLGAPYFTEQEQETMRAEQEEATCTVTALYDFWAAREWGQPLTWWKWREAELNQLLEIYGAEDARFQGLSGADLIGALWIAE